jgi:hypothetical protein
LRQLTTLELDAVMTDGILHTLGDLDALITSPARRLWLQRLAEENGFVGEPEVLAPSVLEYASQDMYSLRDVVAARLGSPVTGRAE